MLSTNRVLAQASTYTFTPSSGTYTAITGGTQLDNTIQDSWTSSAITLSPAFNFAGVNYTTAYVTSNGLLTLGAGAPSTTEYNALDAPTGSGIIIAPFNADLNASASGTPEMRFQTVGSEHVFQWQDARRYNVSGERISFQVRLNTTTGEVKFVYGGTITVGTSTSYFPSVGIGTSTTDYKNIKIGTTSETWAAPLAGTATTSKCRFTSTTSNPKSPTAGQTYSFMPPTCSGLPNPGVLTASVTQNCSAFTSVLTSALTFSFGNTVEWQSSPDSTNWTPVSGATSSSYTASVTATIYYRMKVTCANGGQIAYTPGIKLSLLTPTLNVATLPYSESFESWLSACATNDRPGLSWMCSPVSGNNSWRRHDQGSSAAWGNVTLYLYAPVSTFGDYSARFHSGYAASGTQGKMDLYANLSATGTKYISFDYINTDGTDSLYVEVSTDGGTTFTQIAGMKNAAAWTRKYLTTTATAASAIIRFRAVSDYGSTDIGIDNLLVSATAPCMPPTAATVDGITPTSANLGWTDGGTATQWQIEYGQGNFTQGTGTKVVVSSNPYTLNGLVSFTGYSFFVRAICGAGDSSVWSMRKTFTTLCQYTSLTATTPGSHCGQGVVTLGATAPSGSTVNWYSDSTGGSLLATGNSFTTPTISATTNYYAASQSVIAADSVGLTDTTTNITRGANLTRGIILNVTSNVLLKTAVIYPKGTGTVTVSLRNSSGTEIAVTGALPVTGNSVGSLPVTIPLNFAVAAGTGYQLVLKAISGVTNLVRAPDQTFPMNSNSGIITITNGYQNGTSTVYNYFFNVKADILCISPRTAVAATITTPPAMSVSSPQFPGICTGSSATLNANSADTSYKYTWTPGALTGKNVTVSPTALTKYYVTATDTSTGATGGCVARDSITINVGTQPTTAVITPATGVICPGTATQLSSASSAAATANLGTATTYNSTTDYPSPYTNYYGGTKHQMLIRASELTALGFSAGTTITSIKFFVKSVGVDFSGSLSGFQINAAQVTNNTLNASNFVAAPNVVYGPVTQAIPSSGAVTHTLTTPIVWNGTSNLLIQTSYSNGNLGTSDEYVEMYNTTTSFNSVNWTMDDLSSPADILALSSPDDVSDTRPNMAFDVNTPVPSKWTPVTGLYRDAAMTIPLTATDTAKSVYASPAANSSYTAMGSMNGCLSSVSNTATIAVRTAPITTITTTPSASICAGDTATLSVPDSANFTYQWKESGTAVAGATNSSFKANAAGSFTVSVTNTTTTCSATTQTPTAVTVNPLPTATATAAGTTTFCNGGNVVLNANTGTGLTYQWKLDGVDISGATNVAYTAAASGNYTVTVRNASDCAATSPAVAVTVLAPPTTITPAGSTTFCTGGSVLLNAPAGSGLTYQWSKNGTALSGATTDAYTASTTGSYTVFITDNATTCSATSVAVAVTVGVAPSSAITPAGPVTVCDGTPVALTTNTSPGLSYQWYQNGTAISGATSVTYNATTTGSYTASVSISPTCGSTSATPAIVTVNPLPVSTVTAAGPVVVCAGSTVTLNANTGAGLSYQWQESGTAISGATNATYAATATGNYTVVVTNTNNCAKTSTVTAVTVNPLPAATITAASTTTFCQGGNVVLNANTGTGLSYQWKLNGTAISGATNNNFTATLPGSYVVEVTNAGNCMKASAATTVIVNNNPPVATIGASGSTSICQGSNVVLNIPVVAGQAYQWQLNGNNITGATNASYTAASAGNYSIIVTNTSTTCNSTSAATAVTVTQLPTVSASANGPLAICAGDSVELTTPQTTGITYQWKQNGTSITGATNTTFKAFQSGSYTVVATNSNGCEAISQQIPVTVNPLPSSFITYTTPIEFCDGGAVVLNSNGSSGLSYQWYLNGSPINGAVSVGNVSSQSGFYQVKVTSGLGCSAMSQGVQVTVHPLPQPSIIRNGLTLTTGNFVTYQWYYNGSPVPTATAQSFSVNQNGAYHVQVIDSNGCANTSSVIFINNVGIHGPSFSTSEIKVFPNPTHDIVNIQSPVKVNIQVRDLTGKVIMKQENATQVDLGSLANGVYMLIISDENDALLKTEKLFKSE